MKITKQNLYLVSGFVFILFINFLFVFNYSGSKEKIEKLALEKKELYALVEELETKKQQAENRINQINYEMGIEYHGTIVDLEKTSSEIEPKLEEKKQIVFYKNSDGKAIEQPTLLGLTPGDRAKELLSHYGRNNYQERVVSSKKYGYKTEFLICLAQAESGLGGNLKSMYNYFNCGNNDRGDVMHFSSLNNSIRALHQVCLGGTYLGKKQTLGELSPKHKDSACYNRTDGTCKYAYATSKENWLNNMKNCLSNIRQEQVEESYLFRK